MNDIKKTINVVGLSTITSNEEAFQKNTIAKLWNEFLTNSIKEKISHITSNSIFAVYSDYENGYEGKYRLTIGYAVDQITNGLTLSTIPEGKYQSFKSKSNAPEDIIATWKMIWGLAPKTLQPNFTVTFEEYKDNGDVIIYIGHD